jgi:hypothetical protein
MCYLPAIDRTSGLHMCGRAHCFVLVSGWGERAIFIDAPDRENRACGSVCRFCFVTYVKLRAMKRVAHEK